MEDGSESSIGRSPFRIALRNREINAYATVSPMIGQFRSEGCHSDLLTCGSVHDSLLSGVWIRHQAGARQKRPQGNSDKASHKENPAQGRVQGDNPSLLKACFLPIVPPRGPPLLLLFSKPWIHSVHLWVLHMMLRQPTAASRV